MSMTVEQLETELRNQPEEVRAYLASKLIETLDSPEVDDDAIEGEAHRRYLQLESGEEGGIDGDEVIAQLRARRNLISCAPGDDLLPGYSLKGGVRGKYADRYARDATVVLLDPDVAEVFPDAESVNRALRALAQIIKDQAAKTPA
jgi:hypothetical protein